MKFIYAKGYPSEIKPIIFNNFFNLIENQKGSFVDFFYKQIDTSKLKYVYFEKSNYIETDSYVFVIGLDNNIHKNIFMVYPNNEVRILSNDYLPIIPIIKHYLRHINIKSVL